MSLKYIIVEDEPPARVRLKRMIQDLRPDAVCLEEIEDGVAGLEMLSTTSPDVVFMDIEFPPGGAFELLTQVKENGIQIPPIIFVTAFNQHAIEAFKWSAWDYLLKPVEKERLAESLKRIEERLQPPSELGVLLQALQAAKQVEAPLRFTVMHRGKIKIFSWDEVTYIQLEGINLFVNTMDGRFLLERNINELEKLLATTFVRCHPNSLVNFTRIKEVIPHPPELRLDSGDLIQISMDKLPALKKRLGLS